MASDDTVAKKKGIDDWLPVTASRNAKWWYSAFHNLTAMVGAGVLSLPYAMSMMGWYAKTMHLQTTMLSRKQLMGLVSLS
ncbi:Amino acid transporter, transmembrane domain [Sesbania bispinosa]|nr:Amino acid transporter, transmembrane domain [Sesbania bispinosa]